MNQHGISSDRYTNFALGGTTDKRVAIIDTVGLLAKLYRSSHIAYVGGGFSSGVHNVLEPAAFGQPVIFGPRYFNSHEAQELVKNQSACSITSGVDFTTIVETLIVNESTRITKGTTARNFLQDNLGGTENTIAELSKMNII
jgi:3-deoxy-D-manno-octulosonic-acid transferase